MSQPGRHNHHRARDENAVQRRILDRINDGQGQGKQRGRHHTHVQEEAIVIHHDPDFQNVDQNSTWDGGFGVPMNGTQMGRLMPPPGSSRALQEQDSVEDIPIANYDNYSVLDKDSYLHEHFYDHKRPETKHKHKGAPNRSQSLPPPGEGRRKSGANFFGPPKNFEGQALHISDSRTDFENEEAPKYDKKVANFEGRPPIAERRHSGSSNSSNSNKNDNRLQIPLNTSESMEDFKEMNIANSDGDSPADIGAFMRHDKTQEYSGSGDEYNRDRGIGKKVSYSLEQSDHHLTTVPPKPQTNPVRLRADYVENDESDLEAGNVGIRGRRQAMINTSGRGYQNTPGPGLCCTNSDSHSNLVLRIEDFVGKKGNNLNNNNPPRQINTTCSNASMRYSQDSLNGMGRKASNLYSKDVLPLPIEIPESVADAEAFRRYLSVRRGAIPSSSVHPNQSLEKRKEHSSYDSLGRRNGVGQALGVTPSQRLSQEASRRTASLSHAIMTLALLSASICQLRFLITYSHAHSYPVLNYFLIFTSIILEVAAGIGYVMIARCSYDDVQAEYIHNYLIFALFIVAVSNVVLAAFAFDDHICEDLKKTNGQSSATTLQQNQQINQPMPGADRVMDLRYMPLE